MNRQEPVLDIAGGDIGLSRHLARSLRTIADNTADPGLKTQIREILAGRGSVRELAQGEAFNRLLDRALPSALQAAQRLSDEQLHRLAEQGRGELDRLRNEPPAPEAPAQRPPEPEAPPRQPSAPTPQPPKPSARRELPPEVVEADDEYFQERNRRGWLV
ncbi:hypothetical protein [Nocardia paucivorans]|uniref:hypothetical protein n=1 Tax=Nocardia paucivorans TaxID=114259 RepID=UPI0002E62A75|nr:hypothetical protein [Nocardia paucivorans]